MERTTHSLNSGIYQLQSKTNNKRYIGKSTNLKSRKRSHFKRLKCKNHININLQEHVNIYGIDDIVFSIIEVCYKNKLTQREQYYIDTLKPEFNESLFANGGFHQSHTKETRKKMSLSHKKRYENPEERKKTIVAMEKWREDRKKGLSSSYGERALVCRLKKKIEKLDVVLKEIENAKLLLHAIENHLPYPEFTTIEFKNIQRAVKLINTNIQKPLFKF